MRLSGILVVLAAISVVWYVVSSLLIYEQLRKRGMKVSFLWLRVMILTDADQYRRATREETGKTGPLFYHWIVSIYAALVCVILALLTR
jgi:hypothetical protein